MLTLVTSSLTLLGRKKKDTPYYERDRALPTHEGEWYDVM